jgi:hypothetical protein
MLPSFNDSTYTVCIKFHSFKSWLGEINSEVMSSCSFSIEALYLSFISIYRNLVVLIFYRYTTSVIGEMNWQIPVCFYLIVLFGGDFVNADFPVQISSILMANKLDQNIN